MIFVQTDMHKRTIYHIVACAILMCLCSFSIAQTKSIKGIVNHYSRVTGIDPVTKSVTLEDASMFKQNELPDTVLLIQMTGIPETGNGLGSNGEAGIYEFHIVTHVSGSTITLKYAPSLFNTNELVQMIRVPSYKNVDIDDTLTCRGWDWESGTGGVLALMVEGTLTFNADIDVSGLGFRGGKAGNTQYTGTCSFNTTDRTNLSDYPDYEYLAGYKGEGAVTVNYFDPTDPFSNLKGYGPTWNGGGGGNGKWSGGGGGGNYRLGGVGGDQACGAPGYAMNTLTPNGIAGNMIKYDEFNTYEHVFMGGGGGSGTGIGTAGGNGGGIVIIVAQNLLFKTNTATGAPAAIKVNGSSVQETINFGGAGGGGAGGTILLSVKDYGEIRAEIMGGDGGSVNRINCDNTDNSMGAGGGGSGGFLQISADTTQHRNWLRNGNRLRLNGGVPGKVIVEGGGTSCENSTGRQQGNFRGNFQVQLRGFLNNYIIATPDSICYGEQVTVQASQPMGGTGDYSDFEWQYFSDDDKWMPIPVNTISTVDLSEIRCSFLKDTYVRRMVTSGIIDTSSHIMIRVRNAINGNNIAPADTTLCWRKNRVEIRGAAPTVGGGGGPYSFEWEELDDNDHPLKKIENAINKDLLLELPVSGGILKYKRKVISLVGCESSSNTAMIIVQPAIRNEITPPGITEICGNTAEPLIGPELSGGNGIYNCRWEFNKDENNDLIWQEISNQPSYQPNPGLQGYGEYFYRRIVRSGECSDTSNIVKIRFDRKPLLSEFEIMTNDQTGDLVGEKALKFQFSADLEVLQPSYKGIWTWAWAITNEKMNDHPLYKSVDEPKITVNNLELGMNTIIWEVVNGVCSPESLSVNIEVKDVIIYNGLSPNGDGKNECFLVEGGENAISSELIIIDRYNNVVFKSYLNNDELRNCTCWWDGQSLSGNELPSGTYFYHLILNKEKEKKGYVVLKRQ